MMDELLNSFGIPKCVFEGDANLSNTVEFDRANKRRLKKLQTAFKPVIAKLVRDAFNPLVFFHLMPHGKKVYLRDPNWQPPKITWKETYDDHN